MSSNTETSTPVRRSALLAFLTTCLLVLGSVVMLQALADIQNPPRYKALIIGINDYSDNSESGWPDLKAATKDTDALVDLLQTQYGFKQEDVTYLHDGTATRDRILDALDQVIGRATAQDAVLLYYAGHGATRGGEYYWIPSDATKREKIHREGIPTSPIEVQVKNSAARHVLLVVDSCFAGYMGERRSGTPPAYSRPDPVQLEKQLKERGRHLLVSTDRTTALDQTYTPFKETVAYGGYSPFAAKFLGILKNNTLDWLEARGVEAELTGQLYKETRQWADLKNLSLESSGMFVFHNVLATQSPRPGPSGLRRDSTGGVTVQKEARLVVKSTMGGKLFLNGTLVSEKVPPQAEWDISTGPGSVQLELRGPCETVNRLVNVQEGQGMEVSLEGTPGLSCTALPVSTGNKVQETVAWGSVPAGEFSMGSDDGHSDEQPPLQLAAKSVEDKSRPIFPSALLGWRVAGGATFGKPFGKPEGSLAGIELEAYRLISGRLEARAALSLGLLYIGDVTAWNNSISSSGQDSFASGDMLFNARFHAGARYAWAIWPFGAFVEGGLVGCACGGGPVGGLEARGGIYLYLSDSGRGSIELTAGSEAIALPYFRLVGKGGLNYSWRF